MNILFANSHIEEMFLDLKLMSKKHGMQFTKATHKRYSELKALPDVKSLMDSGLDNPHFLKGDMQNLVGWSITGNIRIIIDVGLKPGEQYGVEIARNNKICIKGVCDYHGSKNEWIIN